VQRISRTCFTGEEMAVHARTQSGDDEVAWVVLDCEREGGRGGDEDEEEAEGVPWRS
jgi:hypothetical protein